MEESIDGDGNALAHGLSDRRFEFEKEFETTQDTIRNLLGVDEFDAEKQQARDRLFNEGRRSLGGRDDARKMLVNQHPDKNDPILIDQRDVGEKIETKDPVFFLELAV